MTTKQKPELTSVALLRRYNAIQDKEDKLFALIKKYMKIRFPEKALMPRHEMLSSLKELALEELLK